MTELVSRKERAIYIAGPMRGYPQFNFPAFHGAAAFLRAHGWKVCNPAEKDEEEYGEDFAASFPDGDIYDATEKGFDLGEALAYDLNWICKEASAIYMLKGWEKSRGAMAEHATAVALELDIYYE